MNAYVNPEKIVQDFKTYSTRALNRVDVNCPVNKWTQKASKRYRWKPENVADAIRYVLYLQGEPMEVYFPTSTMSEPGA